MRMTLLTTAPMTAALCFGLALGGAAPAFAAKKKPEPPPSLAVTPRLAVAGEKNGALVLLDLSSRKADGQLLDANGLLIFPLPSAAEIAAGNPTPDHGRVTLAFDCKARTIQLTHMVFMALDDSVVKEDSPTTEPFPAVDPTDARMLGLACGEIFPEANKTFSSEAAAIETAHAAH